MTLSYSHPPPPQYGHQPSYGGGHSEHPRGTTILVLGILSLVLCGLFTGIPAWVMGRKALHEIEHSPYPVSNRGTVKAGYICGMIGTILSAVVLVFYVIVAIVAVGATST